MTSSESGSDPLQQYRRPRRRSVRVLVGILLLFAIVASLPMYVARKYRLARDETEHALPRVIALLARDPAFASLEVSVQDVEGWPALWFQGRVAGNAEERRLQKLISKHFGERMAADAAYVLFHDDLLEPEAPPTTLQSPELKV